MKIFDKQGNLLVDYGLHANEHEAGGSDEVSLGALSGEITDAQHGVRTQANAHAHSHLSGVTPDQHHAQAHNLASHSTKAHAELTGVTSDQHHARSHDHSNALDGSPIAVAGIPIGVKTATITFIIDGGGSEITTGEKGHLEIPFACTIQQVTMLADQSGSIVVDIWKDTYANFPPTVADSITAAAKPTISAAQKFQDSTLTGWTTSTAAGEILAFNVDSVATITRVTISLKVVKT